MEIQLATDRFALEGGSFSPFPTLTAKVNVKSDASLVEADLRSSVGSPKYSEKLPI